MTYLLLDTSTPQCRVTIITNDGVATEHVWQADRTLARHLLKYITEKLAEDGQTVYSLDGIGVMKGPGSFTGLRIGLTVANTIAESTNTAIVGAAGDSWREDALQRLRAGDNDAIVLPNYGAAARITTPRK